MAESKVRQVKNFKYKPGGNQVPLPVPFAI